MGETEPTPAKKERKQRHLTLLLMLVAVLVTQSFLTPEEIYQRAILNLFLLMLVFSAMRALSASKIRLWATLVCGISAYVLSWVDEIAHSIWMIAAVDCCFAAVFIMLISVLAEDVFREGPVDGDRIMGAVSIFFLLGMVWAFLYAFIDLLHPGSFDFDYTAYATQNYAGFISEYIYFSNVTLTTLGYGDVVPLSQPAKVLASLEAMTGQLYIAIVISRLVGLQIANNREASS